MQNHYNLVYWEEEEEMSYEGAWEMGIALNETPPPEFGRGPGLNHQGFGVCQGGASVSLGLSR